MKWTKVEKGIRFNKIAEMRTIKVLERLSLLGNCADVKNYSYNEEVVKKIFNAIRKRLRVVESKFNQEKEFKLNQVPIKKGRC